jgi:hypothetical protein
MYMGIVQILSLILNTLYQPYRFKRGSLCDDGPMVAQTILILLLMRASGNVPGANVGEDGTLDLIAFVITVSYIFLAWFIIKLLKQYRAAVRSFNNMIEHKVGEEVTTKSSRFNKYGKRLPRLQQGFTDREVSMFASLAEWQFIQDKILTPHEINSMEEHHARAISKDFDGVENGEKNGERGSESSRKSAEAGKQSGNVFKTGAALVLGNAAVQRQLKSTVGAALPDSQDPSVAILEDKELSPWRKVFRLAARQHLEICSDAEIAALKNVSKTLKASSNVASLGHILRHAEAADGTEALNLHNLQRYTVTATPISSPTSGAQKNADGNKQ